MNIQNPRRIITRGVLDMATLLFDRTLEESYLYTGPMALADESSEDKIRKAVTEALAKHMVKVTETVTQVETDLKDNKRIAEGTKEALEKLNKDGAKVVTDYTEYARKTDARVLDLEQKLAARADPALARPGAGKSLGEQVVESEMFKAYAPLGKHAGAAKMQSFHTKTITSLTGSGGPGIFPEYLPTPIIPAFQPLTIRDLIALGTTESNMIIWLQELLFTNNAGYQGSEGALKAQSDLTYIQKNIPIETIAHFIKASKQVLSDFKQLATLINARLTFGLKYAEEQQILYGDGAAGHLHGLVPQATVYNQGYLAASAGPPIVVGDTKIDTLRRAMLQTTLAYYPATGICISPYDWADIQLTKDSLGRYIWANPTTSSPGMIWGLPIAECFSMERGDFLVGALKLAVTLFDREEASILMSNEDQDNFVRNLVTILAEERLGLAVSRPAAIIYGNFKSGETG